MKKLSLLTIAGLAFASLAHAATLTQTTLAINGKHRKNSVSHRNDDD